MSKSIALKILYDKDGNPYPIGPAYEDLNTGATITGWTQGWRSIKFAAYVTEYNQYSRNQSNDVPIFRYAETLLDLAECYANKAGGEAMAKSLLKQVRGRSVDAATDPLNIDNLSGDALKEAIYNEKRLEFIGEGIRGIDIMRRGEHFIKVGENETINVGPSDEKYTWPIPQVELLLNKDINK